MTSRLNRGDMERALAAAVARTRVAALTYSDLSIAVVHESCVVHALVDEECETDQRAKKYVNSHSFQITPLQ